MAWSITPASLKKLCRDHGMYSSAPELNEVLHLQCKGIAKLENLEARIRSSYMTRLRVVIELHRELRRCAAVAARLARPPCNTALAIRSCKQSTKGLRACQSSATKFLQRVPASPSAPCNDISDHPASIVCAAADPACKAPANARAPLAAARPRPQAYTGVKTLYLESNAISVIEGLDALRELRCLYLGKNVIHRISGLDHLTNLESLDLSDNDLTSLHALGGLARLKTLNFANNKCRSAADIAHLQDCPSITSLDLSGNKIDDPEALEVLAGRPLSLLRFSGNPVVSAVRCASGRDGLLRPFL